TTPLATYNFGASAFVEDPTRPVIYATVPGLNSVAVINSSTPAVTNTIPIGSNPSGLALSADGSRLYVANSGSSFIGVLDTQTLYKFNVGTSTPTQAWQMTTGSNGEDLALSHDGGLIAHPNGAPYAITLYRTGDQLATGTLNTGAYPSEFAFSPDDKFGYAVA